MDLLNAASPEQYAAVWARAEIERLKAWQSTGTAPVVNIWDIAFDNAKTLPNIKGLLDLHPPADTVLRSFMKKQYVEDGAKISALFLDHGKQPFVQHMQHSLAASKNFNQWPLGLHNIRNNNKLAQKVVAYGFDVWAARADGVVYIDYLLEHHVSVLAGVVAHAPWTPAQCEQLAIKTLDRHQANTTHKHIPQWRKDAATPSLQRLLKASIKNITKEQKKNLFAQHPQTVAALLEWSRSVPQARAKTSASVPAPVPVVTLEQGTQLLKKPALTTHDVKRIVESGASLEWRDNKNYTLLQRVVRRGLAEATKLLLDAGAKTDVLTSKGENLLHLAVESKHPAVVPLLLDAGVDQTEVSYNGLTPLHWAVLTSPDMVRAFCTHPKVAPNVVTLSSQTPLFYLPIRSNGRDMQHQCIAMVNMLLSCGADPFWRDDTQQTFVERYLTALEQSRQTSQLAGMKVVLDNAVAKFTAHKITQALNEETLEKNDHSSPVKKRRM